MGRARLLLGGMAAMAMVVAAQAQLLVSYPTSLTTADPNNLAAPVTGTLLSASDLPDIHFSMVALDKNNNVEAFKNTLSCPATGDAVENFMPDGAFVLYGEVDENPPACVSFGLLQTAATASSGISVTFDSPASNILLFVHAPIETTSNQLLDDIVFSQDFEILNDGCQLLGLDATDGCHALTRSGTGRLRRYDNSRGTIRFLTAIPGLTIYRNTACQNPFDFTIGMQRKVDCIVGDACPWTDCSATCGNGIQWRTFSQFGPYKGGAECPPATVSQTCNLGDCPQDCVVSDWSDWSACTADCGTGQSTRTRTIVQAAVGTGAQCPALTDSQPCNTQSCPIDCVLSDAGAWSTCSATCGGGTQTRSRTVITPAQFGGDQCEPTEESQPCNTQDCPIDCVQSDWSDWSDCSTDCAGGTKTRHRTTLVFPNDAGQQCGPTEDSATCNTQACPVDCQVSDWSDFGTCSASCGGGTQTKTRTVTTPAANGGATCPALTQTVDCNTQGCPTDCKMGDWSSWSTCSKTCGGGSQTRGRVVTTPATNGGAECGSTTETQTCNSQGCATDCVVSQFSDWSQCSASCGTGTRSRSRTVTSAATNGGATCPALTESESCNTQACPVDCQMSDWSAWGTCSQQCGAGGIQKRTRTITVQPANGGVPCDVLEQSQACNTQTCNVDCVVSDWSSYSTCDKPCGSGLQTRTRTIVTPAQGQGAQCPTLTDSKACNTAACAVDCVMSSYGSWGTCSKTCGGGVQTRTRTVVTPSKNGGATCPCTTDTQACNTQACPVDCKVSDWSCFGSCSATCGGGTQTRTRVVTQAPLNGGAACPALTDSAKCNTQACPVNCVGSWGSWSTCSKTCGGGSQTRTQTITTPSSNGGKCCGSTTETRPCNTDTCVTDCQMSAWSSWGSCSKSCGGGVQTRYRTVTTQPSCKGAQCGALLDTQTCNTQACPVDCQVSAWSKCNQCDKTCGGGKTTMTRTITVQPANGGAACPALTMTSDCNTQACPPAATDCQQSAWSDWSTCSKTCGCGGSQSRTRTTLVPAANGGIQCGPSSESRECNKGVVCVRDCQVTDWSSWSGCTKTCGGGWQLRYRKITQFPSIGGAWCPPLIDTAQCNTQACPVDCQMGAWSNWGTCSKTCGGGTQTRTRSAVVKSCGGGASCPSDTETQACNTQSCATDCVQSAWSSWGTCSKTCGGGIQTRTRKTLTASCGSGASCGSIIDVQACNTRSCAQDCEVSSWSSWSTCSKTCGTGAQTRTRTITKAALNGGTACPCLSESQSCNTAKCTSSSDCKVGDWSSWGTCSKSCGGGTSTRTRKVVSLSCGSGKDCPTLTESTSCNTQACAPAKVDCKVSDFGAWSTCSKSCGTGTQTRSRTVLTAAANGGCACPSLTESQSCNTQTCPAAPTDCKVSDFGSWGTCSKTCGGGVQTRTRVVTQKPCTNGAACPSLTETQSCNTQGCSSDCSVGDTSYTVSGSQVTVKYAKGVDSIDVNVRITYGNGQTMTLNFHPNAGCSSGTTKVFDVSTHPNFPSSSCSTSGAYCIVWVQVNGSNCHYGEGGQAPVCYTPTEKCAWKYNAWGSCSSSCSAGTQTRTTAGCYSTSTGKACASTSSCGTAVTSQSCQGSGSCGVGCTAKDCSGSTATSIVSFAQGSSGTLTGTLKITNPSYGDLNGIFIDFASSSRLAKKSSACTLTGTQVTAVEYGTNKMGCSSDVNLSGCSGPSSYDLAARLGSSGCSKDDISTAIFTLKCTGYTLTTDDVIGASIGVRVTSIGTCAKTRTDSSKQICTVATGVQLA